MSRPLPLLALAAVLAVLAPAATAQYTPDFAPAQPNPFGLKNTDFVPNPVIADFDGDGDVDVLVGALRGDFYYYANTPTSNGMPTLASPVKNPFGLQVIGSRPTPAIGDLDGDGDLDLLSGSDNGDFFYFENRPADDGTPAFQPSVKNPFGLLRLGARTVPALGDIDFDGDLDLIVGNNGPSLVFFRNEPESGSTVPRFIGNIPNPFGLTNFPTGNLAPALADLDLDGDLDLITGDNVSGLYYHENTVVDNSDPRFGLRRQGAFGLPSTYGNDSANPAVGDLDGDLDPDVLVGIGRGDLFYSENTAAVPPPTNVEATLDGAEGFRMLASPVETSVGDFLGAFWTQGFDGSDAPEGDCTVFMFDESGDTFADGWTCVASADTQIRPGNGLMAFIFADDDPTTPEVDGGFPKLLTATVPAPSSSSVVPVTYTDDARSPSQRGWNLVGNPSNSVIVWDQAARTNVGTTVYVYDPNFLDGDYRTWTLDGRSGYGDLISGRIPVFQGFFVQAYDADPTLTVSQSVNTTQPFYGRVAPVDPPTLPMTPLQRAPMSTDAEAGAVDQTVLDVIAPNPTRGRASVAWTLAEAGAVRVSVVDLLGREVAVLADGALAAGPHRADLPAGLAPGVYVVRLAAGSAVSAARFTVVR